MGSEYIIAVNNTTKLGKLELFQKYGALMALVFLLAMNCLITPNFMSVNTLWNIMIQGSTVLLLSLGMTAVIATGGIDISIGSIMGLSAMVLAKILFNHGGILEAVLLAIVVSAFVGLINGFIISFFKLQPMIVTLAFMTAIRGAAQLVNDGVIIQLARPDFTQIAYLRLGGVIPVQFVIIVVAVGLMYFLVTKMSFGRYIQAMGDNTKAASLAGVNTTLITILVYVLSATMAGIGGIVETARITAADPNNIGKLVELDAIAATAIGGTPLSGGKPNIMGTVVGMFIMQLITVMVNMNNIPYAYSLVIKTIIIITAVYLQKMNEK